MFSDLPLGGAAPDADAPPSDASAEAPPVETPPSSGLPAEVPADAAADAPPAEPVPAEAAPVDDPPAVAGDQDIKEPGDVPPASGDQDPSGSGDGDPPADGGDPPADDGGAPLTEPAPWDDISGDAATAEPSEPVTDADNAHTIPNPTDAVTSPDLGAPPFSGAESETHTEHIEIDETITETESEGGDPAP